MARNQKSPFILIFILLILMGYVGYRYYFSYDGFRNIDCAGINCKEGEFCQDNTCQAISPPHTNNYM